MSKVTAWFHNHHKPKDIDSLYNIEIPNQLIINGKTCVVRDCRYNKKFDHFTQIDDLTVFERVEIISWQRQHKPNNRSNE